MEEMKQNTPEQPDRSQPWQPYYQPDMSQPQPISYPWSYAFPTGSRELGFGAAMVLCGLALCNFTLFGGFNLGFAIAAVACILCSTAYLLASGCKPTAYSTTILILCCVIAAAFARSDDGFVQFVMVCFLLVGLNLGFCLTAGQNHRDPDGVGSLLEPFRSVFGFGFGKIPGAFRGLRTALRGSGTVGQKGGAVLLGLVIVLPVLAVLIPLLIRADAAFDGLLLLLPKFDIKEIVITLIFGCGLACFLYTRGVALCHSPKTAAAEKNRRKGLNILTVNTVLGAVCSVYVVYLLSQLAYFVGGFSGILPEGFTVAEYARRGFFEMAWLCAINLAIMTLGVSLVKKNMTAPLSVRLLCLFIGLVTLFLVATASMKMFLYIDAFGLTRLRVLTEVFMIWLGITTVVVSVWLFVPKLPYMKVVILTAMMIGAAVIWVDVDTAVARYNVSAYQTGKLETVDVEYLASLSDGAVPYIARLMDTEDPAVAQAAENALANRRAYHNDDFRDWNYVNEIGEKVLDSLRD